MHYFLGIDGGGTRTTAWLADERGRIVSRAAAGASNPMKVGLRAATHSLTTAAQGALRQAHLSLAELEAVGAGVAGVDRSALHRKLLGALRRAVRARRYLLTVDAAITLEAALGHRPGVIVISGTGSIAYARDRQARTLRCGGWGSTFDDAGSGHDLGRKAVFAALCASDGRGPRTRLEEDLCRALRIRNITQVVGKNLDASQIAALFPVVRKAAEKGDSVAKKLCQQAGSDLAELALPLVRRIGPGTPALRVVCAGGVFRASLGVRRSFAAHLRHAAPGVRISLLQRQPVEGALELARSLGGSSKRMTGATEESEAAAVVKRFQERSLTLPDEHGLIIMKDRRNATCWSTDRHLALGGAALVI